MDECLGHGRDGRTEQIRRRQVGVENPAKTAHGLISLQS
jgi:hypothetical protein